MPTNTLIELRKKVSLIDKKLVKLLAERRKITDKIGILKFISGNLVRDTSREKVLLNQVVRLGKIHYLNPRYITRLFTIIISNSVISQKCLIKSFLNKNRL